MESVPGVFLSFSLLHILFFTRFGDTQDAEILFVLIFWHYYKEYQILGSKQYWSRWLPWKRSWPLFSLNIFCFVFLLLSFLYVYCFPPTSGILRKLKFSFASYFGITRRKIKRVLKLCVVGWLDFVFCVGASASLSIIYRPGNMNFGLS